MPHSIMHQTGPFQQFASHFGILKKVKSPKYSRPWISGTWSVNGLKCSKSRDYFIELPVYCQQTQGGFEQNNICFFKKNFLELEKTQLKQKIITKIAILSVVSCKITQKTQFVPKKSSHHLTKSAKIGALNPKSVLCTDQALSPAFCALNPGSALNPRTLNPGTTANT